MIEQGQSYTVEFNNFRRVHRNRADGELFAIELEIAEEDWHYLADFPRDAIGDMVLRWMERAVAEDRASQRQPRAQQRQSKPKRAKGGHAAMWECLFASTNFRGSTLLLDALDIHQPSEIKAALYRIFNPPEDPERSLSFVSADEFIRWLDSKGLASLVTLVRNAEMQQRRAAIPTNNCEEE